MQACLVAFPCFTLPMTLKSRQQVIEKDMTPRKGTMLTVKDGRKLVSLALLWAECLPQWHPNIIAAPEVNLPQSSLKTCAAQRAGPLSLGTGRKFRSFWVRPATLLQTSREEEMVACVPCRG